MKNLDKTTYYSIYMQFLSLATSEQAPSHPLSEVADMDITTVFHIDILQPELDQ